MNDLEKFQNEYEEIVSQFMFEATGGSLVDLVKTQMTNLNPNYDWTVVAEGNNLIITGIPKVIELQLSFPIDEDPFLV